MKKKINLNFVVREFRINSTNAYVNTNSSIALISRFINSLPNDQFYKLKKEFKESDGKYKCKLILPPNVPFQVQTVCDDIFYSSKKEAYQNSCLLACEKLYELKFLDDNLIPINEKYLIENENYLGEGKEILKNKILMDEFSPKCLKFDNFEIEEIFKLKLNFNKSKTKNNFENQIKLKLKMKIKLKLKTKMKFLNFIVMDIK